MTLALPEEVIDHSSFLFERILRALQYSTLILSESKSSKELLPSLSCLGVSFADFLSYACTHHDPHSVQCIYSIMGNNWYSHLNDIAIATVKLWLKHSAYVLSYCRLSNARQHKPTWDRDFANHFFRREWPKPKFGFNWWNTRITRVVRKNETHGTSLYCFKGIC